MARMAAMIATSEINWRVSYFTDYSSQGKGTPPSGYGACRLAAPAGQCR